MGRSAGDAAGRRRDVWGVVCMDAKFCIPASGTDRAEWAKLGFAVDPRHHQLFRALYAGSIRAVQGTLFGANRSVRSRAAGLLCYGGERVRSDPDTPASGSN